MENLFESLGNILRPENELEKLHNFLDEKIKDLKNLNETNFKSYSFLEPKTEIENTEIYLN